MGWYTQPAHPLIPPGHEGLQHILDLKRHRFWRTWKTWIVWISGPVNVCVCVYFLSATKKKTQLYYMIFLVWDLSKNMSKNVQNMFNAWDPEKHMINYTPWFGVRLDSGQLISWNAASSSIHLSIQPAASVEPTKLGVNSNESFHMTIFTISSMFITRCLTSSLFHWSISPSRRTSFQPLFPWITSCFFECTHTFQNTNEHVDLAFTLQQNRDLSKTTFPNYLVEGMSVCSNLSSPPLALSLRELRSRPWAELPTGFNHSTNLSLCI